MGRRAALSMLLGLLACVTGVGATARPVVHTVTIDGARFTPSELTVKEGDTVVWVNKDILPHTATAKNGSFDSKVIQPGTSWRMVAKKQGEFPYTCSFHPMNATLTVK